MADVTFSILFCTSESAAKRYRSVSPLLQHQARRVLHTEISGMKERQTDCETCADGRCIADMDLTTVCFDEAAHDCKSETGTAGTTIARCFQTNERLEQRFALLERYARSLIIDREPHGL